MPIKKHRCWFLVVLFKQLFYFVNIFHSVHRCISLELFGWTWICFTKQYSTRWTYMSNMLRSNHSTIKFDFARSRCFTKSIEKNNLGTRRIRNDSGKLQIQIRMIFNIQKWIDNFFLCNRNRIQPFRTTHLVIQIKYNQITLFKIQRQKQYQWKIREIYPI